MKFIEIKIGDSVVLRSNSPFIGKNVRLGSVVSVTKTRFKVKFQDVQEIKEYTKKNGTEYPAVLSGLYGSAYVSPIEIATEADILEAENLRAYRRLKAGIGSSLKGIEKSLSLLDGSSKDVEVLKRVESLLLNVSSLVKRSTREDRDEEA